MQEVVTLTTIEQVKALADPLRLRIVHALQPEALHTKALAQRIKEPASKLYYHVEALERFGLIELVETRPNRGTTEKYYRATAKRFIVGYQALAVEVSAANELQNLIASILTITHAELSQHLAHTLTDATAETTSYLFSHSYVRATREQIDQLRTQLHAWLAECRAADQPDGELYYGLTLAFYPMEEQVE